MTQTVSDTVCRTFVLALAGCATPIVQPAGTNELSVRDLPQGTEIVELTTRDGVALRGLFVPAGDDAPVVLHLLPAKTSITSGMEQGPTFPIDGLLHGLCEKGCASLVIDYRGVGASQGECDPESLPDDAWAMWCEAVRRASDRPDGVILRGGSLGTLAAASLIDRGARPQGAIFIAPIRAETISWHAPRQRHGAFLGTVFSWFLRRPLDVDLVAVLQRGSMPILAVLPEHDHYLDDDELASIAAAVTREGNRVERFPGDHYDLVTRAYGWRLERSQDSFGGGVSRELMQPESEFLDAISASPRSGR